MNHKRLLAATALTFYSIFFASQAATLSDEETAEAHRLLIEIGLDEISYQWKFKGNCSIILYQRESRRFFAIRFADFNLEKTTYDDGFITFITNKKSSIQELDKDLKLVDEIGQIKMYEGLNVARYNKSGNTKYADEFPISVAWLANHCKSTGK